MTEDSKNHDLVDSVYAVAMEPERFRELVDIWQRKLREINDGSFPVFSEDLDFLERHFFRANSIMELTSQHEDLLPKPLKEKLNAEPRAMIAVSADGVVEAQNAAAEAIFSLRDGANIRDTLLSAWSKDLLIKDIKRLFNVKETSEVEPPSLHHLEFEEDEILHLASLSIWQTAGQRKFVLVKLNDLTWPEHLTPIIQQAFELTEAEANILKLVAEGLTLERIAAKRDTSINTIRSQIRAIYGKTHTNNQSELVRMAVGLTTLEFAASNILTGAYQRPENVTTVAYPLPEHRRLLSLPDGRLMEYSTFGPEDGKPCIFFHNEFFGDIVPAPMAQAVLQNGLRFIIPARAHYGRSSPPPHGAISYEQTVADLEILLQKLEIEKAVHLSQTVGGMFSMAFAVKNPEQVVAIVAVAPMFPHGAPEDEAKMPKFIRFMSSIVDRHPKMLDYVARAGFVYHRRVGSKRFLETILSQSKLDKQIIDDPDNLDAFVRGFQFSSENGYLGFLYDYRKMLPDSWEKIIDLHCPIYAIIGTDENNSRSERADRLVAAGANIEKIFAPQGGEMLFFSHSDLIVDTLSAAWQKLGQ